MKFSNEGRPEHPVGLTRESVLISLTDCPDCKGRGWFLINPFLTGGRNGVGGIRNLCQCQTCFNAEAYWREHGELPPELVDRIQKHADFAEVTSDS